MKRQCLFVAACLAITSFANAHHGETFNTLKQFPPTMPPMAYQSGYCCMLYDIDENGDVKNVGANYCTEDYLAEPSKKALQKWKYDTKKKDGTPSVSKNLTTYMSFYLTDELGNIIPNQNGFMSQKPDGSRDTEKFCGLIVS